MTATDDALAAHDKALAEYVAFCMSEEARLDHHRLRLKAAVRTAAERYGRAVAIEACRGFIDSENVEAMHGTYIHVRMKQYIERELRAADSTGGT